MDTEDSRLQEMFLSFAGLDSLSFHERGVADRLKNELQKLGFEVTEDDAGVRYGAESGNIYGFLKGTENRQPVLFSAHMDTVAPGKGKQPRVEGDRIVSDGTTVLGADDICGIVEILEGIRLAKQDPAGYGDIEVLFTIAEEVYGKGARGFDFTRLISGDSYVLDMSGPPGSAARKAPSIISFETVITGKAAHAGFAPENGIHALSAAAKAIARIPQGKVSDITTLNIGTIQGGTADNIVPMSVLCTGEVRSFNHEEALRWIERIEKVFREEAEAIGAAAKTDPTVHILAYETGEEAEVCRQFREVCKQLNLPGFLKATHGGSDNNIFAEHGISGIVLSCGMYQTHGTEEYTTLTDLAMGARLVAGIIRNRKQKD